MRNYQTYSATVSVKKLSVTVHSDAQLGKKSRNTPLDLKKRRLLLRSPLNSLSARCIHPRIFGSGTPNARAAAHAAPPEPRETAFPQDDLTAQDEEVEPPSCQLWIDTQEQSIQLHTQGISRKLHARHQVDVRHTADRLDLGVTTPPFIINKRARWSRTRQ